MRFTGLDYEDVPFGAGFAEEGRLPASIRNKNAVVLGLAILGIIVVMVVAVAVVPKFMGNFEIVSTIASAAESTPGSSSESEVAVSSGQNAALASGSGSTSAASAATACVYVHVVGQVKNPGVYELPDGSRVQAAIQAAGGFSKKADTSALNLAAFVSDGEQLIVPKKTNSRSTSDTAASSNASFGASPSSQSKDTSAAHNSLIDINHASAQELTALPGVGESTAAKIIADREANGPFSSPSDIQRVSGIGEKKYESMASMICAK